jgi:hypothetical protein
MLPLAMKNHDWLSLVKISNDHLMFTQSNMDLSNFGVDEQDKTVLTDFRDIGLLPETLVAYTYDSSLAPIASSLGLRNDANTKTLARIRCIWGWCPTTLSVRQLELDVEL